MFSLFKNMTAFFKNLSQILLILIFVLTAGVIFSILSPGYVESTILEFICSVDLIDGFFELVVKATQQVSSESAAIFDVSISEYILKRMLEILTQGIFEGYCIASCVYILKCLQKMIPGMGHINVYPILGTFFGILSGCAVVYFAHGKWVNDAEEYNREAHELMNQTGEIYKAYDIKQVDTTPLCILVCIILLFVAFFVGYIYRRKNKLLRGVSTIKNVLTDFIIIGLDIGVSVILVALWLPTLSIPLMVNISIAQRITCFIGMFILSSAALILVHYCEELTKKLSKSL